MILIPILLTFVLGYWIGQSTWGGRTRAISDRISILKAELQELTLRAARETDAVARILEILARNTAAVEESERLLADREMVIYPRRYPDEGTAALKQRMDRIRTRQSEIRQRGQVVIESGPGRQGKLSREAAKQQKALVRLARLALEGAANTLLDSVTVSNVSKLSGQFTAVVADLDILLRPWGYAIGQNYQGTVRESIELMSEYMQQREREKEEQRALREQMREEAQAQREAEKAQRDAEAEERRVARDLEKAQIAASKALAEEDRDRWMAKVHDLEAALAAAHASKDRAIAMAQLTRAGHVYIISNQGSFGPDVFKIGMTRRLDPLDRVQELGDASVPFPFDIHALIRSDDAPALENALHRAFASRRLNLVNERKEFFRVPITEIQEQVAKSGLSVELTLVAEALQYRQSEAMRAGLHFDVAPLVEEVGAETDAD